MPQTGDVVSDAEMDQTRAYDGLNACRRAAGVARIVMGVHLARLHDNEGWRGRTGAQSFRRFLQEEGIEPKAAYQYITVARSFVLEHQVDPKQIALVGMRTLVAAAPYLRGACLVDGSVGNVDEIVALVTSLPPAEAQETIRERFGLQPSEERPRISAPVTQILGRVDDLTLEQRSELFSKLRFGSIRMPNAAAQ